MLAVSMAMVMALTACSGGGGNVASNTGKSPGGTEKVSSAKTSSTGSATGEVSKEGFPVVKDTLSFTAVGYGEPGCGEWEDYPIFKEIEKNCNVDVTWTTISGDGADEKLGLILSSNELPDMVFSGLGTTKIVSYASKGIIRQMEDLIEAGYAPNLKKILDKNPEIRKAITMPDGHIYVLPVVNENADPVPTTTLNINKAWCDKLGVKPEDIKTVADFENLMKRFVEEDPNGNGEKDEKGFTFEPTPPYHVWNGDADFSGAWGITTDWDPIMVKDDKIACAVTQDGYKNYVKWFAGMYEKGYIDKEVFTHDHNQYMAKIDSGNVGAYLTNGPVTSAKVEYVTIAPLEGPAGRLWGCEDFSIDKGRGLITTACKNPEAAMRFIDSFYEPVTSLKLNHGIYLKDKGDGKFEILPNESGKISEAPGPYVAKDMSKEVVEKYLTKTEDQMKAEERQKLYAPYLMKPLPLMNYTPEEANELSTLSTDISKVVNEQKAKWCTGQGDIDKEWDAYVESLNKIGLERYMEIHNEAYSRFTKS